MSRTRLNPRALALQLVPLAWMTFIFRMSMIPGGQVPGRFGTLAHFTEYAILSGLLVLAIRGRTLTDRVLLAFAWASAYGLTDELHQAFVQLRTPDPADLLVDSAGALCAAVIVGFAIQRVRMRALAETASEEGARTQ